MRLGGGGSRLMPIMLGTRAESVVGEYVIFVEVFPDRPYGSMKLP